ncbi:MAG: DUF1127 domain-containing protein [Gemmobacter sp.]
MTSGLRTTPAALSRPMPPMALTLARVVQLVVAWRERRATRRALARLDPHMLRDIGLPPEAVAHETAKPFWRD